MEATDVTVAAAEETGIPSDAGCSSTFCTLAGGSADEFSSSILFSLAFSFVHSGAFSSGASVTGFGFSSSGTKKTNKIRIVRSFKRMKIEY